jgi:hypothetical protein
MDLSLLKNIVFTGGRALQLRLEAFNALNQPIWGDPDMNMSSSTYGRINTTRSPMRELQNRREVLVLGASSSPRDGVRPLYAIAHVKECEGV